MGIAKFRLRTKFLFSLFLVGAALTLTTCLLPGGRSSAKFASRFFRIFGIRFLPSKMSSDSVEQFLEHSAQFLADLPLLKALMTTEDEATIEDGSKGAVESRWVGFACSFRPQWTSGCAEGAIGFRPRCGSGCDSAMHWRTAENRQWWFGNGRLYEVSIQPIESGPRSESRTLGYLVLGYEVDDAVVRELSQVAASQAAFRYGDTSYSKHAYLQCSKPNSKTAARRKARLARSRAGRDSTGSRAFPSDDRGSLSSGLPAGG